MTCRDCVDFLMAYLDGELPAPQQAHFEAHLADCPPCVVYLETYRQAIALGRAACLCHEEEPTASVPDELVRAILAARKVGS